ncbi:hypothetical protein GCM10009430_32350 [Aquimarina litoralis]|uniref:Peptidase M56 domain-containing protein n=1 Tax=Aquimarina litoralis TaxID=584605 RepID=A0ABN1J206_9FLAO
MLHYTLHIVILHLLFIFIYDIFFARETFFKWNRYYLLVTVSISLILPFVEIPPIFETKIPVANYINQVEHLITHNTSDQPYTLETMIQDTNHSQKKAINWILVIYIIGILINLIFFLKRISKLMRLKTYQKVKNMRVVVIPNSKEAFSFFNTICLGDQVHGYEKKKILKHEIAHVRGKHSLDLIYIEIIKIIFWWNPIIKIYQSRLAEIHEFIADQETVFKFEKNIYIQLLLNKAFDSKGIKFTNNFYNTRLIKNRIKMILKRKSKKINKFKYLLICPVICITLMYTSSNALYE